jgi:alkylation response protein AidB-like acyl-CoA dehydrogenase
MDFGAVELSPDIDAFWGDVRTFLDEHLTGEVREVAERRGDGHHPEFYKALGGKGWILPMWPVNEGGAGLDPLRARILALELAWRRAPSIARLVTITITLGVRAWGSDELRAEVLPRVARGEVCMCLGYTEPDSGSDMAAAKTRAIPDGSGWVISGQKMFTTGAHLSQYIWLLARTNPDVPKNQGLTMFLVPLDLPGIDIAPIETLGGERTNVVYLDDVRIADRYRVGPVDEGWKVVSGALDAEHRMGRPEDRGIGDDDLLGTWQGLIHRLAACGFRWALTSTLPDGGQAFADPLVRQRIAQVALDAEVCAVTPGPMGKVATAEALIRDAADLMDLVGPCALLPRGTDGAVVDGEIEHLHRFVQATAIYGGSTEVFRNMLAERMLRLPRARLLPPEPDRR